MACLPCSSDSRPTAGERSPSVPRSSVPKRTARCRWLRAAVLSAAFVAATPAPVFAQATRASARAAASSGQREGKNGARSLKHDVVEACLNNHAQGQEFRLDGKLIEARDAFLLCSATRCPAQVQRDCVNYLEQVQVELPSVVLRVLADGVSRADVSVSIDGHIVLDKLTGKALELNPGGHELRVALNGYHPYQQSLIVSEGERFRVVEVVFSTPKQAPVEPPHKLEKHRPVPVSTYLLGGLGIVALSSGVGWGLSTWALHDELQAGCAPRCSRASVSVLKQRALFADVSWGIGAVSLITAGVFYLLRPEVVVEQPILVGVAPIDHHGIVGTLGVAGF